MFIRNIQLSSIVLFVTLTISLQGSLVVTEPQSRFGFGDLAGVAVSPNGKHLATAGQGGAFLWDYANATNRARLEAHRSLVYALAFSPNSEVLVTGARDGSLFAWSVAAGSMLRAFSGHHGEIASLAFAPAGDRFVSAGADNAASVWSLESGALLQRVTVPGFWIQDAIFTPDGTRIVTADGSITNNVKLWDLSSGSVVKAFGEHVGNVYALAFLTNGLLATAGDDRKVRLWNTQSGERVRTLEGAGSSIGSMVVLPGTDLLVANDLEGKVITWNTSTGELVDSFIAKGTFALAPAPEPGRLVAANSDLLVRVLNQSTGTAEKTFLGHSTSAFSGVDFSPDAQYVVAGGVEKFTRLWNLTNSQLERTFEGLGSGTVAARFTPQGRVLTTVGFPDHAAQIWSTSDGTLERTFAGHTGWLMAATVSSNGTRIATAAQDKTTRIYDAATGTLIRAFSGHQTWVTAVALSHDGRLVASGGGSSDPTVRVWNVDTGNLLQSFTVDAGTVRAVLFTWNSTQVVVGWEEGLIRAYDLANGSITKELISGGLISGMAISPTGDSLLIAESWPSFAARLLDWETGNLLRLFTGHSGPVGAVAFSPNGRQILTGADIVRLWDITDVAARLRVAKIGPNWNLLWNLGTLQSAPSPAGPWTSLTNATTPFAISPQDPPAVFFRVAVPQ